MDFKSNSNPCAYFPKNCDLFSELPVQSIGCRYDAHYSLMSAAFFHIQRFKCLYLFVILYFLLPTASGGTQ